MIQTLPLLSPLLNHMFIETVSRAVTAWRLVLAGRFQLLNEWCNFVVVKRRILMGTYALSAGYYDAYHKRAEQVRTLVQKSFKSALDENDILISPAAPFAAYKIGGKKDAPLAMYAGDIMTTEVANVVETKATWSDNWSLLKLIRKSCYVHSS